MRFTINKISAFFNLNSQEKTIFIISISILFLTSVLFKLLPFHKLILVTKFISKKKIFHNKKNISYEHIYKIHLKCFELFFNSSCLIKCISAKILLSFYGFEVIVQNGVKMEGNNLKGHAWIVINQNEIVDKKERIDKYSKSFTF